MVCRVTPVLESPVRPETRHETTNDQLSETLNEQETHGVKKVDISPLVSSETESPDGSPDYPYTLCVCTPGPCRSRHPTTGRGEGWEVGGGDRRDDRDERTDDCGRNTSILGGVVLGLGD